MTSWYNATDKLELCKNFYDNEMITITGLIINPIWTGLFANLKRLRGGGGGGKSEDDETW